MKLKNLLFASLAALSLMACSPDTPSSSRPEPTEIPCTVLFYTDVNHVKKEIEMQECVQYGSITKPKDPVCIDEAFPIFVGWKQARSEKLWDFENDYIPLNADHFELYGVWTYDKEANPNLPDEYFETVDVHFGAPSNWDSAFCYYWNDDAAIGAYELWPGIKMEKGADGWFTLDDKIQPHLYTKVIFNNGKGVQTSDLSVPKYQSEDVYFSFGDNKWTNKADAKLPVPEVGQVWNVVGTINGWNVADNTYRFKTTDEINYSITLDLKVDDKFKVVKDHAWDEQKDGTKIDKANSDMSNFVIDTADNNNIVCKTAGTYKISFSVEGSGLLVIKKQ